MSYYNVSKEWVNFIPEWKILGKVELKSSFPIKDKCVNLQPKATIELAFILPKFHNYSQEQSTSQSSSSDTGSITIAIKIVNGQRSSGSKDDLQLKWI